MTEYEREEASMKGHISRYEIGRDIQELRRRIEVLEQATEYL